VALGNILAGNIIYADDLQDEIDFLTALTVEATDNPTKSSDTSLANDSQLLLTYEANVTYEFESDVFYGAGTTADFKYAHTFTNATMTSLSADVLDVTTATTEAQIATLSEASGTAHSVGGAGVSSFRWLRFKARFTTTGTGTLRFQWAQNTSTIENTVRKAGSYMTLRRVA